MSVHSSWFRSDPLLPPPLCSKSYEMAFLTFHGRPFVLPRPLTYFPRHYHYTLTLPPPSIVSPFLIPLWMIRLNNTTIIQPSIRISYGEAYILDCYPRQHTSRGVGKNETAFFSSLFSHFDFYQKLVFYFHVSLVKVSHHNSTTFH